MFSISLRASTPFGIRGHAWEVRFFLTIPISYLVIRLLDVFGILNTFFVLTCFVPIWIMLYCLVSLRFEKACKRFKNKKIVTDWPTCMFFYIVFNVTMILLI